MMNLELVGVSLYSAVSLIGAFFFCVACRYAVCFAFFTLPTKVPDRARASFSRKPNGLNTTQRDGDFYGNAA